MKLFKDDTTGAIVEVVLAPEAVQEITINGTPARELQAGTTDAAQEKHVPAVMQAGDELKVQVGSVAHPMLPEHWITNIWLEYPDGRVEKKTLHPGEEPVAVFDVTGEEGTVSVYEYCNLHGLLLCCPGVPVIAGLTHRADRTGSGGSRWTGRGSQGS